MLTENELRFLSSQKIDPNAVFDGRHYTNKQASEEAKRLGKRLVLGTPCNKGGHRLRTRAGHCVQCDTKKIAYEQRFSKDGYVYIAGSLKGRIIKIGTAKNVENRHAALIAESYGGFSDWELLMSVKVPEAGKIEQEALQDLSRFKFEGHYSKNGKPQKAYELLSCTYTQALVAVVEAIGDGHREGAWRSERWKMFEFGR